MITNIYLLLLYTLSKNSFPSVSNKGARTFSLSIRILFICFIAIVVSKPVETLIYSNQLRKEIEQFRQKQITLYTTSTTEYFDSETANMRSIIDRQQNLGMDNSATQIQVYEELINKKEEQKQKLIRSMTLLVNRSNYYIESIKILNVSYPSCWIITLVIILIFLIPAYIKNLLGENSAFYEIKGKIERRIVIEEYDIFKGKYSSIFQDNFQMDKSFVEIYIDPPFNTIRKKDERTFLKESDLLTDLYNV
jgi:16S rRNA G966 N2-methylase RsmD